MRKTSYPNRFLWNLFHSPTKNLRHVAYPNGKDGTPCKHQPAVVKKYALRTQNFLPMFNALDRQLYSSIATGESLPLNCYLGLKETLHDYEESSNSDTIVLPSGLENGEHQRSVANDLPKNVSKLQDLGEINPAQASDALEQCFNFLKEKINTGDQSFLKGVIKFTKRIMKKSTSQLSTALHCFDSSTKQSSLVRQSISHLKKGRIHVQQGAVTKRIMKKSTSQLSTALHCFDSSTKQSSLVRQSISHLKKGRIHVQQGAVKRRKNPSKSRQALMKGSTSVSMMMPERPNVSKKRINALSQNIANHQQVSKKSGRSMTTLTKQRLTVRSKVKSEGSQNGGNINST